MFNPRSWHSFCSFRSCLDCIAEVAYGWFRRCTRVGVYFYTKQYIKRLVPDYVQDGFAHVGFTCPPKQAGYSHRGPREGLRQGERATARPFPGNLFC